MKEEWQMKPSEDSVGCRLKSKSCLLGEKQTIGSHCMKNRLLNYINMVYRWISFVAHMTENRSWRRLQVENNWQIKQASEGQEVEEEEEEEEDAEDERIRRKEEEDARRRKERRRNEEAK